MWYFLNLWTYMNLDNITQFKFHFNLNVSQFNSEYNQYFVAPLELSFPLTYHLLTWRHTFHTSRSPWIPGQRRWPLRLEWQWTSLLWTLWWHPSHSCSSLGYNWRNLSFLQNPDQRSRRSEWLHQATPGGPLGGPAVGKKRDEMTTSIRCKKQQNLDLQKGASWSDQSDFTTISTLIIVS